MKSIAAVMTADAADVADAADATDVADVADACRDQAVIQNNIHVSILKLSIG